MSSAPPPLKKRKREEPEGGLSLGPPSLDLSGLDVPDDEDTGRDDDPKEGEWLFKQDEVVLGPVSAAVLIQRIQQGELEPYTPVGRNASSWRSLKSVAYFAEILAVAEKRKRAIAEQKAREARQKRQRLIRMTTAAGILLMPMLLGAVAGRAVMIARPWDTADEWLERPPPLVDLPPKPKAAPPPPPKDDQPADDDKDDEGKDDEDSVEEGKDDKKQKTRRSRRRGRRSRGGSAKADKPDDKKPDPKPTKRPDKVLDTLTQKQVMAGLGKGKGGIGRCLKTEMARNPEMPPRITLMFTIKENGRATNFKLKQRSVRKGPLATCMNKVVSGLRWPKFTGERKNVELPLSVKR